MTVGWDLTSCEISAWRKTSCRLRCVLEQISNRRLFARKAVLEISRMTQHASGVSFFRMLAAGVQSTVIGVRNCEMQFIIIIIYCS